MRTTERLAAALMIAVIAAVSSGCAANHTAAFASTDRAAKTLEIEMNAKPDLARYRSLYTSFSGELDRLQSQSLSGRDATRLNEYEEVRARLRDILFIWEEKTSRGAELLPVDNALFGRVAKEYGVPINTNEPPSIYGSEAIQIIWTDAKKKLDAIE